MFYIYIKFIKLTYYWIKDSWRKPLLSTLSSEYDKNTWIWSPQVVLL